MRAVVLGKASNLKNLARIGPTARNVQIERASNFALYLFAYL